MLWKWRDSAWAMELDLHRGDLDYIYSTTYGHPPHIWINTREQNKSKLWAPPSMFSNKHTQKRFNPWHPIWSFEHPLLPPGVIPECRTKVAPKHHWPCSLNQEKIVLSRKKVKRHWTDSVLVKVLVVSSSDIETDSWILK